MSKYEIENVKLIAPKLDRKDLEYAMTYRYACKKFDSTKKISEEDWNAILNAARLAPTSLGFEPFELLVIQNPEIREKMKPHGWGIHAGLEASYLVVFLTRKKVDLEFDSPYVRYIQETVKQLPAEVDAAYREKYAQFTTSDYKTFESERAAFDWASKQAKASAGGYQLSLEAQSQLKALGLTSEYITRILDEADNRQPIPGTSRTVYSLNGYQVEFSHSDQQVIRIARGVAANRNPFESQPRMSGRKRQRGRKIPHDVDEFVQLLQEHGFTVTMGGKHYDIRHEALAPGQKAVTSVTPSDSQRWHLNSARQIRNTFGVDLRYADPRDSVRGIVRGTRPAKDALPAEGSAPEGGKQPADSVS